VPSVSEQLLTVLKICLLVLLYLFFLRVLRAVWAELKAPPVVAAAAPAASRPSRRRSKPRRSSSQLRLVEPVAQRGRTFPLAEEVTVGRAAGCSITLDDTFVSQIHARVFTRDDQWFIEDLGSTNGTYVNRSKVSGPMVLSNGDRFQVGNTVMELT
jgi:pSer/pThr/pTyr-binding forkhead associated (FHA) protein